MPDTLLVPDTSCFQTFCQKMLLETQIGSTSVSQAFFLHHPLGFGHNKTCLFADYFHFPITKRRYDEAWVHFFTISGFPTVPETEHVVITAPEHGVQRSHRCYPRISKRLTYFQWQSWGLQPYMPHQKKDKTLTLDALWQHGRSKRGAPGNLHALSSVWARWPAGERINCKQLVSYL